MNRRFFWIANGLTAGALLAALIQLPRTPLPWFDEVLLVSATRSLITGHTAVPSVLAAFPHTGRSDLFYGPLVFWIGAAIFKAFGFSLWTWRLLGWFSGLTIVLASAVLVRRLGGSAAYAAMAGLMVALTPALGSAFTSGRTDTITVALELCALCLLFPAASIGASLTAGILFAGAILSTPRSHPFMVGCFGVIAGYAIIRRQTAMLRSWLVAGGTAVVIVTIWTISVGLNPVSWYGLLLHASSGDRTNSSPLLGGSWGQFSFDLNSSVVPAGFAVWILLLVWRRWRDGEPSRVAELLLMALLANAGLTLALTSRAMAYQIFWLVPMLPVAVALTSAREPAANPKRFGMLTPLIAILLITGMLRVGKLGEVAVSWKARDPQSIRNFICTQIPANSTVYGPQVYYYYAVEQCGGHYLFPRPWVAMGLRSRLDPDKATFRPGDYLLWPAQMAPLEGAEFKEKSRFVNPPTELKLPPLIEKLVRRAYPYTGGYPDSILYEVE